MKSMAADELITRYLDDSASEDEMSQLNQLLANSVTVRTQFLTATEHAMTLADDGPATQVMVRRSRVTPFPKTMGLIAACLCVLVALAYFMQPTPMAKIVSSAGQVEVPSKEEVISGDTLKTVGPASFLNFEFADGTRVHLGGDTIATVTGDGQKRLVVHQGAASLDVRPQAASRPLVLMTPTAEITVLGTAFGVFASEGATRLEVAEGAVNLKRLADGQSLRVKSGEYSVASDVRDDFEVKTIPKLSSRWFADLRSQPERLLGIGVAEKDKNGAIIGARGEPGYGAAEVIATRNAWRLGDYALFRAKEDTVLKVRLKMDKPQWLNFIVNFRSSEPGSTDTVTCLYQDPQLAKLAPGQWHTVELPLSKPVKLGEYLGDAKNIPIGWSCFSVAVSAGDEQRGLVIQKMWTE